MMQSGGATPADFRYSPLMEEKDNSVLDEFMPLESVGSLAQESMLWIQNTLLTSDVAIQLGLVIAAIVPVAMFGSSFRDFIRTRLSNRVDIGFVNRLVDAVAILGVPVILYLTLAVFKLALGSAEHPTEWISAAIALMNAWIVIRMVSLVIQSPFWSSFAFYVDEPAPICNLMVIGHSSIEFDLRFWINDPEEGLTNVRSDVLMGIWQGLRDANIEVPFPQQDLHIKHWPENGTPKIGAYVNV